MRRWYADLIIKSKNVKEIRNFLFSKYEFDDMYDDEDEKEEIFHIEKNTLYFEGDDGFNFTNKNTCEIPTVKDLFIDICKEFSKEKIEAKVILANSIDASYNEYEILYENLMLIIKENNKIVEKINLLNLIEEKIIEPSYIIESNYSISDIFVNKIEIYNYPCLPSIFIIQTKKIKYFLEVYFDMGYLSITLYNFENFNEIVKIENDFGNEQEFTKDIASVEFKKLEEELNKLQIKIDNIKDANEEEELKYYELWEMKNFNENITY